MSDPKRPTTHTSSLNGIFRDQVIYYIAREADAYMDSLEAEITQLRTERDRYKMALEDIEEYTSSSPIHMGKWVYERAHAALTQREGGENE